MFIADNAQARATLFNHIQTVEGYADFGEPTAQMMADHGQAVDQQRVMSHQANRGVRELADALDLPYWKFEAHFADKSVLNVGCGDGVLDYQLARKGKTTVTALDHDPSMLAKVPVLPNIRKVEGSGYDLQAAIGAEEFDIVMVAFSSLTWVRSVEEVRRGIDSALMACKIGGAAIFIPIIQHPKSHEIYRTQLGRGIVPGYLSGQVAPSAVERAANAMRVESWLRAAKLRRFEAAERAGAVSCSYVASAFNRTRTPIHRILGPDHVYEDYSVVATVLEK